MIERRLNDIEKQVKESESINLLEKKFLILLIKMFKNEKKFLILLIKMFENDIEKKSKNKLANMGRYIDNINKAARDEMEEIRWLLKEHLN